MRKIAVVIAITVCLLAVSPSLALAKVQSGDPPPGASMTGTTQQATALFTLTTNEQRVIQLINAQRTRRGLVPVSANLSLMKAARAHSAEMAARHYFSHSSYNGEDYAARLSRYGYTRAGYTSWAVGENIAWGQGILGTPEGIVDMWMHSAGHRAVILTARFRDVGVGIAKGTLNGRTGFFFTLDLGRRVK